MRDGEEYGAAGADIGADLSRRWPQKAASVDLIACNLVLEHIKELGFIFSEARRVLRAGGLFFICELHPYRQYLGKQANFRGRRGVVRVPAFVHDIADFAGAAEEAGFSMVKLNEWRAASDDGKAPRLISFLFERR